jgi:hypothetical protein
MAPSRAALVRMLNVAEVYSSEFDVKFNSDKSKFILFEDNLNHHIVAPLQFGNSVLKQVSSDQHLGHLIGPAVNNNMITHCINDFYGKVNLMSAQFTHASVFVKYKLFKSFCMPLYGSPLWDYSSKGVKSFYVAWRKSIRQLLKLPYRAHCALLNEICGDLPVDAQLHKRFLFFFRSLAKSTNKCVALCSKLTLSGSMSAVGNSLNYICHLYGIDKYKLDVTNICRVENMDVLSLEEKAKASVIRDLLVMKDNHNYDVLSKAEIDALIPILCTD